VNNRVRSVGAVIVAVMMLCTMNTAAVAQETDSRFDIGLRGIVLLSKGQPANDMIGEGLIARWRIRDQWHLGLALDSATFDYETPNRTLNIASATVVDGINDWSRTSVLIERRHDTERTWDWYWTVGVGFASVDTVQNIPGTRVGGGTFNIATVADDEVHLMGGAGLRRPLGERWALETTFTFEHHTTDYQLVDLVSGTRGSIDSHSPYGIAVGLSYRFQSH
jgi:hypothetical protein